jgi:hypothetical protein
MYPEPFDYAQGSVLSQVERAEQAKRVEGLPFDPSAHFVCSGSW